jgi:hypothetical protein
MVVAAIGCGGQVGSGSVTSGNATGGKATAGNATGGSAASSATGGNATGATGGNATGGNATGGNAIGGFATGGSWTGGNATGGSVPVQVASRWPFEGATNLPTNYGDLNYDVVSAGFVQNGKMWLLAGSSLSGEYHYSMWECEIVP